MQEIPNPVIVVVGDILGRSYYNHTDLNTLFIENGAPGDAPDGNCVTKCQRWLKRCNEDPSIDALAILGAVIKSIMEPKFNIYHTSEPDSEEKIRITEVLIKNGLKYCVGGKIMGNKSVAASITLDSILRKRDLPGVQKEFDRAINMINTDPGAAATAGCAIIESLLKIYIEDEVLTMPKDMDIGGLWKVVKNHIGLDPAKIQDDDLRKILSGLASIIDGIGALRTHAGSAHGQGRKMYKIEPRHARLVINASHTLTLFIIDIWDSKH